MAYDDLLLNKGAERGETELYSNNMQKETPQGSENVFLLKKDMRIAHTRSFPELPPYIDLVLLNIISSKCLYTLEYSTVQ